ncbi:hypothetical protein V5O48_004940 [Marasmius crinis-equi]|uniref:Amino acid transporter n=1 Tax=Marasmius crinis-equi TaxID=585013 RepID=A0ABR3FNS5_9AGAR
MNLHTKSTDRSDSDADLETVKRADNVLLAKLGYKSEFRRDFSLIETIAFAFSIMGLVSAISTTLSFPLVGGGHVGMVFGWLIPCFFVFTVALSMAELTSSMPTSAGLYYFAAKLAPDGYGPLASWITGWANITGQVALVCGIDFTTTQMITTAIIVGTDGATIPSPGATYGMFLAILFTHGILCSAATKVIARLNVLYTIINHDSAAHISEEIAGAAQAAPIAILAGVGATAVLAWILLIATSFVIPSIGDLLATQLPLPMGQVFLDVLGKQGMLSIWPFIIVVGRWRLAWFQMVEKN